MDHSARKIQEIVISSYTHEMLAKATQSGDFVVQTIPEPVLGLNIDLGQFISFQFSSFKSGDRNYASQGLVETSCLEMDVYKAHWNFHAKSSVLF